MSNADEYVPPNIWTFSDENGGQWAGTNRPTAGATHQMTLPKGKHPHQLYSLATPNGVKVTVMFEELLEAGHSGADYDAWIIDIGKGDQFGSDFVAINPNSKIPAMLDYSTPKPTRVFESASIMLYLAKKFGAFFPEDPAQQVEVMNWLFWQVGSAPYLGGGFGHFYAYAPWKMKYPIDRFAMETKRQLDVLDRALAETQFIAGEDYSIADMAIWPWYGNLALGRQYNAGEFLQVESYEHIQRWAKAIDARPAVIRGRKVNRAWGEPNEQLPNRHSAADFDALT